MTAPAIDAPPVRHRAPTAAPRQRPARPRPQLRVVPREATAEARRRRLVRRGAALAAGVVALCLFGVVVAHVVLTQNQFRLDQLREQSSDGQAEYDRLRLQVAELESPGRIVATAQQRLGMVTPTTITYLAPSQEASPAEPVIVKEGTTALPNSSSWSTVKPHLAEG